MSTWMILLIGVGIGLLLTSLLRRNAVVRPQDSDWQHSNLREQVPTQPAPVAGITSELERLQQLMLNGSLTQDEFALLKARLVNGEGTEPSLNGHCTITVVSGTRNKISDIKAVRSLTHLGLKDAKDFVDHLPQVLATDVPRPEAERRKRLLEAEGMTVRIG